MAEPPSSPDSRPRRAQESSKKPWPMSWVLIAILVYITCQVAYFLFFGG